MRISPTPSQVGDVDARRRRTGSAMLTSTRTGRAVLRSPPAGADKSSARRAARAIGVRRRGGSSRRRPSVGLQHDAAMLGVEQRNAVDRRSPQRRARPPSARRASAPAWRHGSPSCLPSARCRRRRSSRSRGSASARCRRRTGWRPAGALRRRPSVSARSTWSRISLQVGGAGAEIVVVRRFVAGDLGVERVDPGVVGRGACGDRREGRLGQRLVVQHGELEFEDRRRSRRRAVADQRGDAAPIACGDRRLAALRASAAASPLRQIARHLPGASGNSGPSA